MENRTGRIHSNGRRKLSRRFVSQVQIGQSEVTRTLLRGELHEPETRLIPNVLRAALGEISAVSVFGNDYPTPDGTPIGPERPWAGSPLILISSRSFAGLGVAHKLASRSSVGIDRSRDEAAWNRCGHR